MEVKKKKEVSGYLKKKKGSRFFRIFGNTNLRWFEIHFATRTFGYKNKHTNAVLSQTYHFKEIIDFSESLSPEDAKMCDWKYGFQLKLPSKILVLYANGEKEFKMWTFAFKLLLKRPEVFEVLKPKIFTRALEIFEKPYLEMLKKKDSEEKRIKKEKEERHRKEEERHQKILEEERQEAKRKRMDNYYKIEEEKENKKLYDQNHRSIIEEVSENVLNNLDSDGNKTKNFANTNSMNVSYISNSKVNLKVKQNLEDWGIYDSSDKKVELAELSDMNPITKYKKQAEIDKEPKQIKELFKYEQSFVNFNNQPVEEVNFRPSSKSVKNKNANEKISFNKSFHSINKESTGINHNNNQSIFGEISEISFITTEIKKDKQKEFKNNNNRSGIPSTGNKNESNLKFQLNSSINQHESYVDFKENPLFPNTSTNNKNVFLEEMNFGEVKNKPKHVDLEKMNLNSSLNITLETKGEVQKNKVLNHEVEKKTNGFAREIPKSKNNSINLNSNKNKSTFKEFLDFEDDLNILNNFTTDDKNKKNKKEELNENNKISKIPENFYRSSDDIKTVTFKPVQLNESKNSKFNNDSEENSLELNVYNNISEKINTNYSMETKNKFGNENLLQPNLENNVFHKRNKSSYHKKINSSMNNFSSNLNNIIKEDEIITNITEKIGLKIKSPDLENFSMPIAQESKIVQLQSQVQSQTSNVAQLPPPYKKKAQPVPPNNLNKKKFLNNNNNSNKNTNITIPATPIELTFDVSSKNDKSKKNEFDEEDWFSHKSNKNNTSLNNSGTDLKSKYKINVNATTNNNNNAKIENVDLSKKQNNLLSVFANENSFMRSNRNEDSHYSLESEFNDSRHIIEQQKALNKYKEELASIKATPKFDEESKKNIVKIDDKLKILDNLDNDEDDELNKILHKHIIETNLATSQEKEELNYSTTKEVDELRNYSKIMKNSNFISQIELKPNETISSLSNLNTNHSSNVRNSLSSKNNKTSAMKKPETPKNNFIEKRLKDSKFLNFDEW